MRNVPLPSFGAEPPEAVSFVTLPYSTRRGLVYGFLKLCFSGVCRAFVLLAISAPIASNCNLHRPRIIRLFI